jgi:hypothetical protein
VAVLDSIDPRCLASLQTFAVEILPTRVGVLVRQSVRIGSANCFFYPGPGAALLLKRFCASMYDLSERFCVKGALGTGLSHQAHLVIEIHGCRAENNDASVCTGDKLNGRQQQCGGQKSQVKKTNDVQKEGASEGVLYRW